MTKREKHEIACLTRVIMEYCNSRAAGDDEIVVRYQKLYGSLKGLRKYVHDELEEFYSICEPYLDKEYLDYCWLKVDGRILNLDDAWCFIRDGLEFDIEHK